MEININCVRDILEAVKNLSAPNQSIAFVVRPTPYHQTQAITVDLSDKYSFNEIEYHLKYCSNNLWLQGYKTYSELQIVKDITQKGREYLEEIREKSKSEKLKETIKDIDVTSFGSIAESVKNKILGD